MAVSDAVHVLDERARLLWVLGVAWYGVGDAATTLYGLTRTTHSIAEAGPVAGVAFSAYGAAGIVSLKLAVFVLAAVAWRLAPRPQAVGVPLGLAAFGVLVTAWNAFVILSS